MRYKQGVYNMYLKWQRKNFEDDIDFILFHQQDDTPAWWRKPLFKKYPELNYEYCYKLTQQDRFEYIRKKMSEIAENRKTEIDSAVKKFEQNWSAISDRINDIYTAVFCENCEIILNDMQALVGLNPVCPRDLSENSFSVYYKDSDRDVIETALHEITHFVWFYFWQKYFNDDYEEYDHPHLKWLVSEIVVETIIRNSELIDLISSDTKYIAYSYFYNMEINGEQLFDTMKNLFINRKNMKDFMLSSYNYCKENEKELRKKIQAAEN